jgi:hypothetical protein
MSYSMNEPTEFELLEEYLAGLHPLLFSEAFTTISWSSLVDQIEVFTKLINNALRHYHDTSDEEDKARISPTLCYCQALLILLCRLARFDEKDLTRYNQIVADMENMLLERTELVETKFREQAEYQNRITKDEKLKDMMERFLSTCKFDTH